MWQDGNANIHKFILSLSSQLGHDSDVIAPGIAELVNTIPGHNFAELYHPVVMMRVTHIANCSNYKLTNRMAIFFKLKTGLKRVLF